MNGERIAEMMRRAATLAEQGRFGASPNPLVGAIVLDRDGEIAGEGSHLACGGPHAEVVALEQAGPRSVGGTLLATLEPCVHQGRTPPCVEAILAAGIARVVIGARDPNPLVNGRGVEALRAGGVEVVEGIEADRCRAVARRFFHWVETGQPFVALKMAVTLDGKLAARGGKSRWITSESSRREGYALREEYDAVLVGVGTVRADDPRLSRHLGLNPDPHVRRVVLDSTLRTPPGGMLLSQYPEDVVLFCREDPPDDRRRELTEAGASIVTVGTDEQGRCDLRQVLRWLATHDTSSVLVEGGGEVHWSFLRERLAQRVHAFVAPLVLGGRDAVSAVGGDGFASPQEGVRLRFEDVRRLEGDLVITAEVERV